jgi:integrase
MQNQAILRQKSELLTKTKYIPTTQKILNRGMNLDECRAICISPEIPIREKLFFSIIYETQLRPFEALNLQIENWDRKQQTVTALRTKQKWDNRNKDYLISPPRTAIVTENTNEMLRKIIGVRKKGSIFVNENAEQLSLPWFNERINYFAKILGIQRIKKYYIDGRTLKLVTCMALREAGERHHDNAGGSRKLSAVAAGHTMQVKERHYEKVGDDYEQVHDSYKEYHPAFTESW